MHSKVKNCSGATTRILCVEWRKYAGFCWWGAWGHNHYQSSDGLFLKCGIPFSINILHVTSNVLSIVFKIVRRGERWLLGDSITTLLMAMGEGDG